jgi:hypothetical protein
MALSAYGAFEILRAKRNKLLAVAEAEGALGPKRCETSVAGLTYKSRCEVRAYTELVRTFE